MRQRARNMLLGRSSAAVVVIFSAAITAIAGIPAAGQQLVPFRIGMQLPAIFEYLYINYAIDSGLLRNEGIDGKIIGFTAGLTATQAVAGGSLDAACDGFTEDLTGGSSPLRAPGLRSRNPTDDAGP